MTTNREPIGVIGTGYVGLVTAAGFAELGSEVYCIDIDAEKIAGLREGRIPIYERGLEELVAKHRERMHFSTDLTDALEHARLLFVAVGTPPTYSGDADLTAVMSVVKVNGRRFELFNDGKRVRLVAWRTPRAVYWVSNTLTQSLSRSEIVGIAASLRRLKQ